MADPRAITENKSSSMNLQTRKTSSLKKPSDQAVNYFNAQNLLNKNQTTSLARDAVANKMSGAVALSATATFPTTSPKLPSVNLSIPKPLTVKLTEQDKRNIAMMAELEPFYNSGDYIGFWNKAKEYDDPLAQLALDFHGSLYGNTLPTRIAVSKLELAYTGGDTRLPPDELAQLKVVVGKGLMVKHFKALREDIDESIGKPGVLSVSQIDTYHYDYFEDIGLPPRTYGGWFVPGALYCSSCDPISE